jgi:hypothetical protein
MRLCLATPCLTDEGLSRLSPLLEILRGSRSPADVVINDWGALRLLACRPVDLDVWLGRLITTRHCLVPGPASGTPSPGAGRFLESLRDQRIAGLEMNSVRALAAHLPLLSEFGLKAALHTPYIFLTMTRYCPRVGADRWYYRDSISGCGHECDRCAGVVANPVRGSDLHIAGNALFLKRDLEYLRPDLQVDRIIDNNRLMPVPPLRDADRALPGTDGNNP